MHRPSSEHRSSSEQAPRSSEQTPRSSEQAPTSSEQAPIKFRTSTDQVMPPMRLMGGSPLAITFPLSTLERSLPLPIISYGIFCSLCLLIHRLKSAISISSSLFTFAPHERAPCFSHVLEFYVISSPSYSPSPPPNNSLHCTEI